MTKTETADQQANFTRYRPGQLTGHYESFFVRANHPSRPLAFWIRYTIFSPDRHPEQAIGELWAIVFDGENLRHVAVKKEVPFNRCDFKADEFLIQIDAARMERGRSEGAASSGDHTVEWRLAFDGKSPPLYLLPLNMYAARFPKAKSLVPMPMAMFNGTLIVDNETIDVRNWVGSQNHNWGAKHTDLYAWGQVAGFDNAPDSFLEVATARLKIGPVWTPFMTPIVLRHHGEEIALNGLMQTLRAQAAFHYFAWHFRSATEAVSIEGMIAAPHAAFVGLRYHNPPGGIKQCLNTKTAACNLTVTHRRSGAVETLSTRQRAAFEILTDDRSHGIPLQV